MYFTFSLSKISNTDRRQTSLLSNYINSDGGGGGGGGGGGMMVMVDWYDGGKVWREIGR